MPVVKTGEECDCTVGGDNHIAGHSGSLGGVGVECLAFRVEQERIGDSGGFLEPGHGGRVFLKVYAKEDEVRVRLVCLPDFFFDMGHFFPAHAAPAGGELEHDDFSPQAAKGDGFPVRINQFDVGSFLSDSHQIAPVVLSGQEFARKGDDEKQGEYGSHVILYGFDNRAS